MNDVTSVQRATCTEAMRVLEAYALWTGDKTMDRVVGHVRPILEAGGSDVEIEVLSMLVALLTSALESEIDRGCES